MEADITTYRNRLTKASKYKRALWNVVWTLFFRTNLDREKYEIRWRNWLLRKFGAKIGRGCVVFSTVRIWQPWNLELGDHVTLSEGVNCYAVDKIRIGSQSVISCDAFLCTASHDIESPSHDLTFAPIEIGEHCWVAARSIVMPGRRIGDGGVVAAGAVVVKDVAPWTVVGGNPARFLKERKVRTATSDCETVD